MKTKTGFKVLLFILLLVKASVSHAQGGGSPCDTGFPDADGNCPLDTWVILLVVAASLLAFFRLRRQSKAA